MLFRLIFRPTGAVDMHAQPATTAAPAEYIASREGALFVGRGSHENGAANCLAAGAHSSNGRVQ